MVSRYHRSIFIIHTVLYKPRAPKAEEWLSGRKRSLGKRVEGNTSRRFESCLFRFGYSLHTVHSPECTHEEREHERTKYDWQHRHCEHARHQYENVLPRLLCRDHDRIDLCFDTRQFCILNFYTIHTTSIPNTVMRKRPSSLLSHQRHLITFGRSCFLRKT